MEIIFEKYQGTGNDFIMIDGREELCFDKSDHELIERMCNRHYGIGADGLIILEPSEIADFRMTYFNSDGYLSTMCGNGGRCIIFFANQLGIITNECTFEAVDGLHKGYILSDSPPVVRLGMQDVKVVLELENDDFFIDTGSPHYIHYVNAMPEFFVQEAGRIRYSEPYREEGVNVNFVLQESPGNIEIRTFERGVEGETLSCGTGVTASAISYAHKEGMEGLNNVQVHTQGGELSVNFNVEKGQYTKVQLTGQVKPVFSGIFKP
ncbi:MAG TPA: diaminopimelate epimerase [Saprospiraceae bacterium]|nr:diaminopimelate epimerase [Lewinellaceae bacterium]HRX28551.1 diaminopimelate epimerase [Saprospiraceae bacterium]